MIIPKVVVAGPRGNKCKGCGEKVKAPSVVLKAETEFNRFSGHMKIEKFCSKCGKDRLEKSIDRLKELWDILENGPSDKSKLGGVKVRKV